MREKNFIFGARASLVALIFLDMTMLALSSAFVVVFYYYHGAQFSFALYQRLIWTPILFLGIATAMGQQPRSHDALGYNLGRHAGLRGR